MIRILAVVVALFAAKVMALPAPPLANGIEPFPLGEVSHFTERRVIDYRLILGAVVKIERQVRVNREQRLNGTLQQITWEIPRSHQPEEAFNFMRTQLVDLGARILFECVGRDCGASNIWANDLFDNSTLYGRDDSQRYLAASLNGNYFSVYAVRRGNQRVYLHLDLLLSDSENQQTWDLALNTQGYAVLPDWPDSPDVAVEQLAQWMEQHSDSIRIVVHQKDRDIDLSQRNAQRLAEALRQRLIAAGIAATRIEAYGVGALVPSVLGGNTQVAVVIRY